jgi:hypothetical protein
MKIYKIKILPGFMHIKLGFSYNESAYIEDVKFEFFMVVYLGVHGRIILKWI